MNLGINLFFCLSAGLIIHESSAYTYGVEVKKLFVLDDDSNDVIAVESDNGRTTVQWKKEITADDQLTLYYRIQLVREGQRRKTIVSNRHAAVKLLVCDGSKIADQKSLDRNINKIFSLEFMRARDCPIEKGKTDVPDVLSFEFDVSEKLKCGTHRLRLSLIDDNKKNFVSDGVLLSSDFTYTLTPVTHDCTEGP